MKFTVLLLSVVHLAVATPPLFFPSGNEQIQLGGLQHESFPGFSLDLSAQRLVQFEKGDPVWMTELEKIHAKANGVKFMDITETSELENYARLRTQGKTAFPYPSNADRVRPVLKLLSTEGPRKNLLHFSTAFRTRHYRSDAGRKSQVWLLSRIQEITQKWASPSMQELISIEEFHHSWLQKSIIVRINGTSDNSVVIIAAHQDSTNIIPFLPAPGADDDGSGTVTILEAYRALIASDFRPVRTVEFHWYSAEEGGLLGSRAVALNYASRGATVVAMSQFDMTAWVARGTPEQVGIITDFTDEGLTEFNKQLVDLYLDIPFVETKCGYACSDHASWMQAGYPSAFSIESTFMQANKNIHSISDRIDISDEFSFDHMLQFSKLAVAFAIELGGWTKHG